MIYFIQETGLFRNRIKIGRTNHIKKRLGDLRGGSPSTLKVLLVLPGDTREEMYYHERFTKYRLHGEWFKYGLEMKLFVWINQAKFTPLLPTTEDDIEIINEAVIEAVEAEDEEEAIERTEDEKELIRTYTEHIKSTPSNEISWRTVTQSCWGKGKYGTFYTRKLTAILDKHSIDRTMIPWNGS